MKDLLRTALEGYVAHRVPHDPAVTAAGVLILLFEHRGDPHIVFQKRTDRVRDHKGQISFPGGAMDPGDQDVLYCALRETHEEIGVAPRDVDVLGRVDDMITISNFLVTPYVGWLSRYPYGWKFSDEEVAYLLEVPVPHLLDPDNFVADRRVINGREYVLPAYQFGDDLIWGATARMLSNFLEIYGSLGGLR
ncbi:MAG: CoA pyrophosphatase [Dehalococcoidia bacterium]|nr:CoA pyrophosphatase [Dehalococcoidia bacterium]